MELDAYALQLGLPRLGDLPLDRFMSLVYGWATRGADRDAVAKFRARLFRPDPRNPEPIPDHSPWSDASTLASFRAFKESAGSSGA